MLFNFRLNQKNYPDYKCSLLQGNQLFNKLLQLLFGKPSHKILQQVFQNIQACLKLKIVDFCSNFYSSPPLQISVYNYVRIFLTKIFQKKKCTNEVLLGNIIHRYFYNQNVPFFTSQSKVKIHVLNYIHLIFFLYLTSYFFQIKLQQLLLGILKYGNSKICSISYYLKIFKCSRLFQFLFCSLVVCYYHF
eukprot:TRINITY_DN5444_c0_g1_i10.p1 TRINITY_DN5444_c0_g1~~TRINITY_DN5444_c0_g1_i10.p1  ORF type:complete len:190 (+),score=-13.64 TRINITY_DN5444_c0_g1_i10:550-1119(+)